MHIAWLGKKSPFCGNVTYGREVTNALLDRGHQVSFLHFAQDEPSSQDWPDYAEVTIPFLYKSQVYTIPTLKSSKVLMQSLRELKPDIVHASLTLSPLDFRLPEICLELDIPLFATFHTPFGGKSFNFKAQTQLISYQLYAPFLANYDRVVIFSYRQRDILIKLGVTPENLVVIPNGVDAEKYSPGRGLYKTQFQAERLFVYLGRMATEKNIEAMLKGWKHAEMGGGAKLIMVGDGPLTPSLKPFYGEDDGIIWLGVIADEQKRIDILRSADAFILPSLVEGLSLSLLEAMACGTATIATDAGADGEVLEGGAGIILSTQGVTSQLKTLLPILRDHPEMTEILGHKARKRVLERYTLSQNITLLEKAYEEVLQKRQFSFTKRFLSSF